MFSEILDFPLIKEQKHFFWDVCFGKLPADQLFDLRKDPDCLTNLVGSVDYQSLKQQLFDELKAQKDPRMFGQGHIFDEAPSASPHERHFYERFMKGEKINARWVNETDFEKEPLPE